MTSLQSRHTGFWLHLAAWSVVFGLPLFVPGGREPVMNMQEYVRFLVVPLSFMAVFYVNYLLLIDRYLFTRHVGRFLLANALLVAGVMLLVHLFFRFGIPPRPHHPPMERPWQDTMFFFLRNAMLYLLVVGVSVAIRMTGQWYRAENIRKDLERSRRSITMGSETHGPGTDRAGKGGVPWWSRWTRAAASAAACAPGPAR